MNLIEYQNKSRETWIFNHKNDEIRAVLGLVGESGEVAEKYKKRFRGDKKYEGQQGECIFSSELLNELGDVLYYIARVCDYCGFTLEDVANNNIQKLAKRKQNGNLKGSGDNR